MKLGAVLGGIAEGYNKQREANQTAQQNADAEVQRQKLLAAQAKIKADSSTWTVGGGPGGPTNDAATPPLTADQLQSQYGTSNTPAPNFDDPNSGAPDPNKWVSGLAADAPPAPPAPTAQVDPTVTTNPTSPVAPLAGAGPMGVGAPTRDASGAIVPTPFAPPPQAPPAGLPLHPATYAPPAAAPVAAPAPQAAAGDISPDIVQTIIQEDPTHAKAIASVIRNRMVQGGETAEQVVSDPNQFGRGAPTASLEHKAFVRTQARPDAQPGSPLYQQIASSITPILTGSEKPLGDWTGYYSPSAMKAAGRVNADGTPKKVSWDDGTGVNIGGNLFFSHPYKGAAHTAAAGPASAAVPPAGLGAVSQPQDAAPVDTYSDAVPQPRQAPSVGDYVAYKDATGRTKFTAHPAYYTQDDVDLHNADIYRQNGLTDQATALEDSVAARRLKNQEYQSGQIDYEQKQIAQKISNAATPQDLEAAHLSSSNGRYGTTTTDTRTGWITAKEYDNNTGNLMATRTFTGQKDPNTGEWIQQPFDQMRGLFQAQLGDYGKYLRDTQDANGTYQLRSAAAGESRATAASTTADVNAGAPAAKVGLMRSQTTAAAASAADSEAHAVAEDNDNKWTSVTMPLQKNALAVLSDPRSAPQDRAQATATLQAIKGQYTATEHPIDTGTGLPVTGRTNVDGTEEIYSPTLHQFVPANMGPAQAIIERDPDVISGKISFAKAFADGKVVWRYPVNLPGANPQGYQTLGEAHAAVKALTPKPGLFGVGGALHPNGAAFNPTPPGQ